MADNRGNLRGSASNNGTSVGGAADFLKLSKALKDAGQKGLRNELNKAMKNAAKPLIPKVRAAAMKQLPKKGGLNAHTAKKPVQAQTRTGAKTAGVRIIDRKTDPRMNATGRIAHPIFGRGGADYVQFFPGAVGYFSETLSREGPAIRDDLVQALEDFAGRLIKEV